MVVNLDIALCPDVNVEQAVPREDVQHMVEERHTGFDFGPPAAVDIQRNTDIGFFRLTFGLAYASHTFSFSFESRFDRARVIVKSLEPSQLNNAWR